MKEQLSENRSRNAGAISFIMINYLSFADYVLLGKGVKSFFSRRTVLKQEFARDEIVTSDKI